MTPLALFLALRSFPGGRRKAERESALFDCCYSCVVGPSLAAASVGANAANVDAVVVVVGLRRLAE